MRLKVKKGNYFRTANGKLLSAYYEEHTKDWTVGIQGTSKWYAAKTREEAKELIRKLLTYDGR